MQPLGPGEAERAAGVRGWKRACAILPAAGVEEGVVTEEGVRPAQKEACLLEVRGEPPYIGLSSESGQELHGGCARVHAHGCVFV